MKVVFDTNILIAAFITEGICAKLLLRARKKQFHLLICPFILREFEHTLAKKIKAGKDEVKDALELISEAAKETIHPTSEVTGVCRDADDNNILACALAAEADYIVTGDKDLLELKSYRGIKIITPKGFELLFED